jgi:uncharacterized protein
MFSYRIFETAEDTLLAICDSELLGKTLKGDHVEMTVDPSFYSGNTCDMHSVLPLIRKSTIINAVGNKIVSLLIDNAIVSESCVIRIGNVMHAQVVVVR